MSSPTQTALGLGITLLITVFLFHAGITNSFAADDYVHLNRNIHFQNWQEASAVFLELDGREYRPLVRFSLWINYQMTGNSAVSFHFTNLLLHLGCVVGVYFAGRLLFCSATQAWLGSFIFALHPIHATNVNFVMGRTDLLCAFFYLGALIFFLKSFPILKGRIYRLLSFFFFLFALCSKEMAVTLPLILVLAIIFLKPLDGQSRRIGSILPATLPFGIVAVGYVFCRILFWSHHPEGVAVYMDYCPTNIIGNFLKSAFGLIYPLDLYEARSIYENRPLVFIMLAGAVGMALLVLLASHLQKSKVFLKDKMLWFGMLWFVVTLLPVIGGSSLRWYLYLPSVGLVFFFIAIYRFFDESKGKYIAICLGIWAALGATELYKQALRWKTQSQLINNFLEKAKESGLDKLDAFYFANVPFGYKSTFLLTHHSIIDAFNLYFGRKPQITILSYLNLSDAPKIKIVQANRKLAFQIEPDIYSFFVFPPDKRVLPQPGAVMSQKDYEVVVDRLTPSHLAASYGVRMITPSQMPLYCFDGKEIFRVNLEQRHD